MFDPVSVALERAMSAVDELDRRCCEPGRSPRLAALSDKLVEVRRVTDGIDEGRPDVILGLLEEAGAMVGALQVGCCAPNRLPLYASVLEQLNVLQRELAPMH
jgi:hypothetical protein